MKLLIEHMMQYKKTILASIICVVFVVGSQLIQPRLIQDMIAGIMEDNFTQVRTISIWLLVFAGIGLIAGLFNTRLAAKVSHQVARNMRESLFRKIQTLSLKEIEHFTTGSLVVRQTNDIRRVQGLTMAIMQSFFAFPMIFIGSFLFAMFTLPRLWWVVLVLVVAVVVICMGIMGSLVKKFERIQQYTDRLNAITKDNLLGIRLIKSFVQEKRQVETFTKDSNVMMRDYISVSKMIGIMAPAFMGVMNLLMLVSIILVSRWIAVDPLLIAAFGSFVNYLGIIMIAIVSGSVIMTELGTATASVKRINEVMNAEPSIVYQEGEQLEALEGSIEFRNVSFSYKEADQMKQSEQNTEESSEEWALRNLSFSIKAGQMIGIVGATGSGKSTLVELMTRLYDPQEGEILVGGHTVSTIPKATLRENISIVLQKPILFKGSIQQNIQYGSRQSGINEVKKASAIAQAQEFIHRLPDQYHAEVEERGSNFSGGQKQRLCIARGLVGEPSILILDDSTSALDARSESLVRKALYSDLPHTTKVIVSSKISSVIHADQILVLDQGELVGIGTHEELKKHCTVYQEILETQRGKEVA